MLLTSQFSRVLAQTGPRLNLFRAIQRSHPTNTRIIRLKYAQPVFSRLCLEHFLKNILYFGPLFLIHLVVNQIFVLFAFEFECL